MGEQKRVLVVLSGCGYLDGAEIQEAVLSLLFLDRGGAAVTVAAPDKLQHHVVDHYRKAPTEESRNVLVEAARVARSAIRPLGEIQASDFDAVMIPGGFGAAKNLSSLAFDGPQATVDADFARVVKGFFAAGKPIGAVCIAPAVLVAALREGTVTIGDDAGTAGAIRAMGGGHQDCAVTEVCEDAAHKIISAPAYMYDARISEVAVGIEAVVSRVLALA